MIRLLPIAAILAVGAQEARHAGDTQSTRLSVVVHDDHGAALSGVPLLARTSLDEAHVVTGEDGRGQLDVRFAASDRAIRVTLAPAFGEGSAETARYDDLVRKYAFHSGYRVPLEKDAAACSVVIDAEPAIAAKGVVVDEAGHAVGRAHESVLLCPGYIARTKTDAGGRFTLGSIPNKGAEVFVLFDSCVGVLAPVAIPAAAPGETVDVGELRTPTLKCSVTFAPSIKNGGGLFKTYGSNGGGVTLVRSDGTLVLSVISKGGKAVKSYADESPPMIPPGEYYIAAGLFTGTPAQVGLIHAVRQNDLSASGIPSFAAVDGKPVQIEIDLMQAEKAIRSFLKIDD